MRSIQVSIVGFQGKPSTVYATYAEDQGVLVIAKAEKYRMDRFKNCAFVSNANLADRDVLFSEDNFRDAIDNFFLMHRTDQLLIESAAQASNPENSIEQDGVRENGRPQYRLSPDITSAMVAVLAACWYTQRANAITQQISMQDSLMKIMSGEIATI